MAQLEEEKNKNDENDLNLLIRILEEMSRSLEKDYIYQSPWQSLFNDNEESLRDKGYLVSKNEKLKAKEFSRLIICLWKKRNK